MVHDSQPSLQYGGHNCNVGAMPQQPAVVQLAVLCKSPPLRVSVHSPHIQQLLSRTCCLWWSCKEWLKAGVSAACDYYKRFQVCVWLGQAT